MWSAFQRQWEHKFPGPKITPRVCNWGIWFYNRSRSHIFLTEPRINHYLLKSMWWKNLPVNHRSSKRRNQIYLIFILSFLYFEGRGLYMEAITINQETILSSKRGGYHSMIKTWQCVIRVSVYMADIFADIKWKNFQCKGQVSQEDILASSHWSFLPKFHCGCTVWKQKRALLRLSPPLSSNSNLLFALSNISKGGHSPMLILFQQLLYSVQLIIFLDYLGEVSWFL